MADDLRVPVDLNEAFITRLDEQPKPGAEHKPDPEIEGLARAVAAARQQAEALAQAAQRVSDDITLTVEARALRRRTIAMESAARVAKLLDAARAQATVSVEQLRSRTAMPPVPREPGAIALEGEIRAALKSLPESERDAAISEAFANRDAAIVGAVLRGPAFLSGVGAAKLPIYQRRYRDTWHPDDSAALDRRVKALEKFESLGRLFVSWSGKLINNRQAQLADAALRARQESEAALQAQGGS